MCVLVNVDRPASRSVILKKSIVEFCGNRLWSEWIYELFKFKIRTNYLTLSAWEVALHYLSFINDPK